MRGEEGCNFTLAALPFWPGAPKRVPKGLLKDTLYQFGTPLVNISDQIWILFTCQFLICSMAQRMGRELNLKLILGILPIGAIGTWAPWPLKSPQGLIVRPSRPY